MTQLESQLDSLQHPLFYPTNWQQVLVHMYHGYIYCSLTLPKGHVGCLQKYMWKKVSPLGVELL